MEPLGGVLIRVPVLTVSTGFKGSRMTISQRKINSNLDSFLGRCRGISLSVSKDFKWTQILEEIGTRPFKESGEFYKR